MTATVSLLAINSSGGANPGAQFQARSGTSYTADAYGVVKNVAIGDIANLLASGCVPLSPSGGKSNLTATTDPGTTNDSTQDYVQGSRWLNTSSQKEFVCVDATASAAIWVKVVSSAQASGSNGLFATALGLLNFKNSDGSTIAASASAGKFGIAITLGTSFALASESANNSTKTDVALLEFVLPANYKAGTNITATVNASITGAGTLTTKTAQIKAYRTASDGTQGADIGPGSATAMTAAGADVPFTITGTTLNPGDKLALSLTTILTETASSGMVANINSVRLS